MKTKLFEVTDVATAVTTASACRKVTIQEDPSVSDWPTTDYAVMAPLSTDDAKQKPAGTSFIFDAGQDNYWSVGETIGYVKILTGVSTDFSQVEE